MQTNGKMTVQNVKLTPKEEDRNGELAPVVHYECEFCGKRQPLTPTCRKLCERLSGPNQFFCNFCLRQGYNHKSNRDVLVLSFRAIVAYYHIVLYRHENKLFVNEIAEYVRAHAASGLINPVFSYDWDSMLWFIDFSKVGRGHKKIKLTDVQQTILNILMTFNLIEHVSGIRLQKFYQRYDEAVIKFHSQRYRPEGKRELIPTLMGCCDVPGLNKQKTLDFDATRNFTSRNLVQK